MDKLAEPYKWESDIVFPEIIQQEINSLLSLSASCHQSGIDMRHVFIGITADNQLVFMDLSDVPPALGPAWVMMQADQSKCVALVMCSEGWTVPQDVAKRWMKDGRPSGSISEQPEAYEVLMIGVETQKGHWMGQTKIIGEHPNRSLEGVLKIEKADQVGGSNNNLLRCHWMDDPIGTLRKSKQAKDFVQTNEDVTT